MQGLYFIALLSADAAGAARVKPRRIKTKPGARVAAACPPGGGSILSGGRTRPAGNLLPLPSQSSIAPDFTLRDAVGRPHGLADALDHGPVLLSFFKISCTTCQYSLGFLHRLYREFVGTAASIWTISQDTPEHTQLFNQEFGISLPQLFDAEAEDFPVSDVYGIEFVPTTLVIEPSATIAESCVGWSREEFERMVSTLARLAGVEQPSPFGPGDTVEDYRSGCRSKN